MVDRPALEQCREEESRRISQNKTHGDPNGLPKVVMLEDAIQEEENGKFVHSLGQEVEQLAEEVVLRDVISVYTLENEV